MFEKDLKSKDIIIQDQNQKIKEITERFIQEYQSHDRKEKEYILELQELRNQIQRFDTNKSNIN